jgi:hypothetical protein
VPYLRASILTQTASLLVFLTRMRVAWLDYPALVLAPLTVGCAYNYWHWPRVGARSIGTRLRDFVLGRNGAREARVSAERGTPASWGGQGR